MVAFVVFMGMGHLVSNNVQLRKHHLSYMTQNMLWYFPLIIFVSYAYIHKSIQHGINCVRWWCHVIEQQVITLFIKFYDAIQCHQMSFPVPHIPEYGEACKQSLSINANHDINSRILSEATLSATAAIYQVPVSISDKTSYRKISWSLEAARLVVWIIASLWNLAGTSATVLPMSLSNFRAIGLY